MKMDGDTLPRFLTRGVFASVFSIAHRGMAERQAHVPRGVWMKPLAKAAVGDILPIPWFGTVSI